jgi:hypothetical protein
MVGAKRTRIAPAGTVDDAEPHGMGRRSPTEKPSREAAMSTNTEKRTRDRRVADCVWCGARFATIVDLLAHVEDRHLADEDNVAA